MKSKNYSVRYSVRVKQEQPTYMKYLEIGLGIGLAVTFIYCIANQKKQLEHLIRPQETIEQKVEQ